MLQEDASCIHALPGKLSAPIVHQQNSGANGSWPRFLALPLITSILQQFDLLRATSAIEWQHSSASGRAVPVVFCDVRKNICRCLIICTDLPPTNLLASPDDHHPFMFSFLDISLPWQIPAGRRQLRSTV